MDGIPDELLLQIFGHVDDARTLLDAVPLVCKRWHMLSSDSRAWATVSVRGAITQEKARTVLRAPHLRRLVVSQTLSVEAEYKLQLALHHSQATVQELRVGGIKPAPALLAMLWRSRQHIRALDLQGCLSHEQMTIRTNFGPLGWLAVLRQLRRLEALAFFGLGPLPAYSGELAGRLLRLRRLDLDPELVNNDLLAVLTRMNRIGATPDPSCNALLLDLLQGAPLVLRHVHLPYMLPLNVEMKDDLMRCVGLRSLSCRMVDVAVVGAMAGLQSIEIYVSPSNAASESNYSWRSLPALRRLSVTFAFKPEFYEAHRTQLTQTLVGLAEAAPGITHLCIRNDAMECVQHIVDHLRNLEAVYLHNCSPAILPKLTSLDHLKMLRVVICCTVGERSDCENAFKTFKDRKPNVMALFTIVHY